MKLHKDWTALVHRLCSTHNLTAVSYRKGIKLLQDGHVVGVVHRTPSDFRAMKNLEHDIIRSIR